MKHRTETTPPRLTADQLRQLIAAEKKGVRPPCFLCGEPVLDQKFLLGEDENDRLIVNSPCLHAMTYGAQLAAQVEAQMRMEAATQATELGEPAAGVREVRIRVQAPTDENAAQWADTIRDLVIAEHGQDMRLDVTVGRVVR